MIVAHRLLKNSVPSDEYILITDAFASRCMDIDIDKFTPCIENCEGIGTVQAYYRNLGEEQPPTNRISARHKWADFFKIEGYMIKRWFKPRTYDYRNLSGL